MGRRQRSAHRCWMGWIKRVTLTMTRYPLSQSGFFLGASPFSRKAATSNQLPEGSSTSENTEELQTHIIITFTARDRPSFPQVEGLFYLLLNSNTLLSSSVFHWHSFFIHLVRFTRVPTDGWTVLHKSPSYPKTTEALDTMLPMLNNMVNNQDIREKWREPRPFLSFSCMEMRGQG